MKFCIKLCKGKKKLQNDMLSLNHSLPCGFTCSSGKYLLANTIIQAVQYTPLLYQLLEEHGDTCEVIIKF